MRRNVPSLLRKFGRWRPTARKLAAGQAGAGDPSALLALDVYKTQSPAREDPVSDLRERTVSEPTTDRR
jgi:hypothetical protein